MKYILGSDSLTAFVQGKPYTVNKTAEIYQMALQALRDDSEDAFLQAVDMKTTIARMFSDCGDVEVNGRRIMYGNREITGLIARRVFELVENKLPVTPMLNLIGNLMQNPSKRAVDETFGFVDACSLPITEDGCILAYRKVGSDYLDQHSRTVPNKPAELFTEEEFDAMPIVCGKQNEVLVDINDYSGNTIVWMDRNLVDEDKDRTCSQGLHFCSFDYLKHFGGQHIIVVKINPKDIVAIPSDYNNAKGRTSCYEIIEEIEMEGMVAKKELTQASASEVDQQQAEIAERNQLILNYLEAGMTVTYVANEFGLSRRQVARIRDSV